MASIYKAHDLKSGMPVAVKVPFMKYESDPAFFSRFQREEEIGKTLNHPNILHVIPVEEKSRPYIAMELLEGQTLRQVLNNIKKFPVNEALAIATSVADAVEHMHEK